MANETWQVTFDPLDILTGGHFSTIDIAYTLTLRCFTPGTQLQNGKQWTVIEGDERQYLIADDGTKVLANENRLFATHGSLRPSARDVGMARLKWIQDNGGANEQELVKHTGLGKHAVRKWARAMIKAGLLVLDGEVYDVVD